MTEKITIQEIELRMTQLTAKQRRLLDTFADMSDVDTRSPTQEVAKRLGVSRRAVDFMLQRIYIVLQVTSLIAAIILYIKWLTTDNLKKSLATIKL